MYESNGEKYFVVDAHMHYWSAAPDNWVPGAEKYAKGWIECFHAYQGLGPPETHWSMEHFETYSEDDLMKDVFEDGLRGRGHLPAHLPQGVVQGGLQHHRAQRADGREAPRQVHLQHPLRPARRRHGPRRAQAERRAVRLQGRQALHRGVEQRLARVQAERPRARTATWRPRRTSASRTSTCTRARRSGRWTRTPSTCPTSTTARPTSRTSTSSSSTWACRGSRTSASWPPRSRTCTPGFRWSSAASCTRGRTSSPRSWASCCSGSARTR